MKKNIRLLILLTILSSNLTAQPGALDNNFGAGGFVLSNAGGQNKSDGYDVVVQPDGKTVVCGKAKMISPVVRAVLIRYNPDGSPDSSFGTNGAVHESFSGSFANFSSVALQPDGKLVISGLAYRNDSPFVLFARYNADGSLDKSFRDKNSALKYYGFGDVACGVLVQPDKKILLLLNNNEDLTFKAQSQIERFNEDGTLDKTFGKNGNVTYTGDFWFTKFTQDRLGRIICLSGDAGFTNLVRLKNNGSPDRTFGVNGFVSIRVSPYDGSDNLVAEQDGKIIVCGFLQASNFVDNLFSVFRFNENGSVDSSFNGTGINATKITGIDYTYDVALQSNGKIIATGFSIAPNATYITLMRYKPNGSIDSTWGINGIDTVATTWDGYRYSYGVASAISDDGSRIVVTGNQVGKTFSRSQFLTAKFIVRNSDFPDEASFAKQRILPGPDLSAYPNPARGSTTASFNLKQKSKVQISLIDTKGKTVLQPYNGLLDEGDHHVQISLDKLAAGIYYISIQTQAEKKSIQLIKY